MIRYMDSLTTRLVLNSHSKRSLQLLSMLESEKELTIKEISNKTQFSKRTIQSDINELRYWFGDSIELCGAITGMRMTIHDYVGYYQKKRMLYDQEPLLKIVKKLFQGNKRTVSEWTVDLNCSLSTFNRLTNILRDVLSDYHIQLGASPLSFKGPEIKIRKFYWDLICECTFFEIDDPIDLSEKMIGIFPDISFSKVRKITHLIYQRLGQGTLNFPEHVQNFLLNHTLFKETLSTIRQIRQFQLVSNDLIEKEAFFICIMACAQCNFLGKTNIPLIELSHTGSSIGEELLIFLEKCIRDVEVNCNIVEINDFLSRQYAKFLLDPLYLKNDQRMNQFAQSLEPDLFAYLKEYITNLNIPNHFTGYWIHDFCASFITYLYLNQKIDFTRNILVVFTTRSFIDETASILIENIFHHRLTIVYEDSNLEEKLKAFNGQIIMTNIIPFRYKVQNHTKIIHLPLISEVSDICQLIKTIIEIELSEIHPFNTE